MIKAIAFDFNGVIVDDEPLHYASFRDAFAPYGYTFSEEQYWDRYLAYDDEQAVRMVRKDAEDSGVSFPDGVTEQELIRAKIDLYMAMIEDAPPFFPGAIEAVRDAANRYPVVIVSGARREEVELTLRAAHIEDLFKAIIAAEDTKESKPHPAPYLRATALLDKAPGEILAIEDSVGGLKSARAAGLRTVGVTHSYPREKLTEAHDIIDVIADLPAFLDLLGD